jgi:ribonuclease R
LDLRDRVIFTIDGADTRDIDDAISVKINDDDTYELGVHIADVSHYVEKDSLLDKEAYERGTSVYLVDRVIPMLPHRLSNGICSLNPNVDRLAMSCIMTIDKKGRVVGSKIAKSVIRSRIQMTYEAVNDILDKGIVADGYEDYVDDLKIMKEISELLRKKMVSRGYIEFSSPEAKIIVDEECKPIDIKLRNEGTGENMIENFMVAANETVGSFVFYQNLPGIYRVHDKPDEKKLTSFFQFLSARGYVVNGKRKSITSRDLQNILKQLDDKPDSKILNDLAIRSQAKAVYSNENIGHFGLGSKCYSHFTSPIRRYPDLFIHRIISKYIEKGYNMNDEWKQEYEQKAVNFAEKSSEREKIAQKVERDSVDIKKAEFMQSKIGEEYEGIISNITSFGVFVELENTVEGLIRFENLGNEYFEYDDAHKQLIGEHTKKVYKMGDKITIQVIEANKNLKRVAFAKAKE